MSVENNVAAAMSLTLNNSEEIISPQFRLHLLPLPPDCLRLLFFFLQSQKRQIAIGQEHQEDMTVPSCPGATFMVIQAEFFFELLITMLYPVPFMVETGKVNRRQMLWHVAEKIAELMSALCQLATLNQQPNLFV